MNLYVRVPIFSRKGNEVLKQRQNLFAMWHARNSARVRKEFGLDIVHYKLLMPAEVLRLSNNVNVSYPDAPDAEVFKGLAIRLELLAVLDLLDTSEPCYRNRSYFVMIDGSGAFSYDSIGLVLDKLINEGAAVVLGKRPGKDPKWLMDSPDRKKVELFEKFLLETRYREEIDDIERRYDTSLRLDDPRADPPIRNELPDSQAGCWGICLGAAKHLGLTAQNYGLEFDLTASALAARLPIQFTDELKPGERAGGSSFSGFDTAILKLGFVLHKLGYNKSDLKELLSTFQANSPVDRRIPQAYLDRIDRFLIRPPGDDLYTPSF